MTKKVKLEPSEQIEHNENELVVDNTLEQKEYIEDEQTILENLVPKYIQEKESSYVLNQIYNMIAIYYSVAQLEETSIPKEANWYLNQILLLLKEFKIIGT